jgi:hypothetical protein
MNYLPNFLIIGATKSGTSSLYFYLRQHPDVFMPEVKEPHFFGFEPDTEVWEIRNAKRQRNSFVITDPEAYQSLFKAATPNQVRGEASVMYMYLPGSAARIKAHVPEAKLIAVLRNPVERAYSAYLHFVREAEEPCTTFADALAAEPTRVAEGWAARYYYQEMGFYARQLSRFYNEFRAEQLRVFLYDDFRKDPQGVTRSIYRFIGVDESFTPNTTTKHNISGVPKNRLLHQVHRFLKNDHPLKNLAKTFIRPSARSVLKRQWLARLESQNLSKPPLSDELAAQLTEVYRSDILELQELLGRDLSHWLAPPKSQNAG